MLLLQIKKKNNWGKKSEILSIVMRVYVKTQINLQNLSTPIPYIENTFSPKETDLFLIEDLVMTPGIESPFKGTFA